MCMLVKSVHMRHMSKAATTLRAWMFTAFLLRQRNIIISDKYLKVQILNLGSEINNLLLFHHVD